MVKEFFYFFIACTMFGNNRNIMFFPCSPIFSSNGGIYFFFFFFPHQSCSLVHWLPMAFIMEFVFLFQSSPSQFTFIERSHIPSHLPFPLLLLCFSLCLPSYNHKIQNILLFIATFFKVKIMANSPLRNYLSSAQSHVICYLPQFPG